MWYKSALRVRGPDAGNYFENDERQQPHLSNLGDAQVVQGLPERAALVAHGDSWQGLLSFGSGAVATEPTTTPAFVLSNQGNAPTGVNRVAKSLGALIVLDSMVLQKLTVDTTQADEIALYLQCFDSTLTTWNGNASLAPSSLSGRYSYAGPARRGSGVSGNASASKWDVVNIAGNKCPVAAGSAWQTTEVPLRGRYVLWPGQSMGGFISSLSVGAAHWAVYVRWHEVQLPVVS